MSAEQRAPRRKCEINTCGHDSSARVSHPLRPGDLTVLCEHHAETVLEEIDGAEPEGDL